MLTNLILGLGIGFILALTGAGGGIMAVPLLVFGAHLSVAQAGPIALLAVGMSAALGSLLGLRIGIVRYRAALLISVVGMLFSPVGIWLANSIDNRWLTMLFSLTLLFVAFKTFQQSRAHSTNIPAVGQAPPCVRLSDGRFAWTRPCAQALGISGAIAGLLSGLLGVGGGFVLVPALLRNTDLEMQSVVATSLAVITLVSATGVVSGFAAGNLNWLIAIPFSTGALTGMLGGRLLSVKLDESKLHLGFALVSAVVACGMIAKAIA